jgi:uncharacterized NAD(P)/FAD-binding protein YdhS
MDRASIVIIGAGFSGTLLARGLQDCVPAGTSIHLVEVSGRFGPGLAYSAGNYNHLLNVPAGRMSAFPDQPLGFLHWLQSKAEPESTLGEGSFAPRAAYGAYLSDCLRDGLHDRYSAALKLWHDTAVALVPQDRGVVVHLASGRRLQADLAVLAMGNFPPLPPIDVTALLAAGLWRGEAWSADSFADLDPAAPVLLIGTGLTMVDTAIALLDAGQHGPIHALSRRGLLPCRHLDRPAPAATLPQPLPRELAQLTRLVRQEIVRAVAAGEPWQPVIDALRPATQALWHGLGPIEQGRFLRHLRCWWDIYRHRMPPQAADRIALARAAGQLQVHAGRITATAIAGDHAEITYRPRGQLGSRALHVARVINCTGPAGDITRVGDPLVQALLRDGVARPDPLRLGFDVAGNGAVIGRSGAATPRLFAVGPLTKGRWWEITAVPDIRKQCQEMAHTLGSLLGAVGEGFCADTRGGKTVCYLQD